MPTLCFVQHRPGSRIPRLMKAMHARGWRIRVLTREPLWRHADLAEAVDEWRTPHDILRYVAQDACSERPADVYHVSQDQNLDWIAPMMVAQRNVVHLQDLGRPSIRGQRVVWDVRDMDSLSLRQVAGRQDGALSPPGQYPSIWEVWGSSRVDGLVHVSEECRDWHRAYYPTARWTPTVVTRSFVGEDQLCPWPDPADRMGLVYCGGISVPHPEEGFAHTRSYGPEFEAALAGHPAAWDIHPACIQAADFTLREDHRAFEALGAIVFPRVAQEHLVRSLCRFRWGLVGFPISYPIGEAAGPNKLGEYLAAGVVPVAVRCAAAERFLREEGVGIGARSMEEALPEMTRDTWERCHARLRERFDRYTMEREAVAYERMLREVMGKPPRCKTWATPREDIFDPMGLDFAHRMEAAKEAMEATT